MEWNTSLGNIYNLPFLFKVEIMKPMTLQLMMCLVMRNVCVYVYIPVKLFVICTVYMCVIDVHICKCVCLN